MGALVLIGVVAMPTAALATSTQWKLGFYTGNSGFNFKSAPSGEFDFPAVPTQCSPAPACDGNIGQGPALLLNNTSPLTGNLTEKTITITFTISGATGAFNFGGEPDGSGSTAANARLYWDSASITKDKTFVETNYWWSDTDVVNLANGTFTLTTTVDPSNWSDYYGKVGSSVTSAFAAAAMNVQDVGLSFGGGYFAATGVAPRTGREP